jgi:hypothetical protein
MYGKVHRLKTSRTGARGTRRVMTTKRVMTRIRKRTAHILERRRIKVLTMTVTDTGTQTTTEVMGDEGEKRTEETRDRPR